MKSKKTGIWIAIIVILFIGFLGGAAYIGYKEIYPSTILKSTEENSDGDTAGSKKQPFNSEDVFPRWDNDAFDKFKKIENNQVIFDKELVSYFIVQTIKRLGTSNGTIEYSYQFNDDLKGVKIFMKWKHQNKVQRKRYTIFIDGL